MEVTIDDLSFVCHINYPDGSCAAFSLLYGCGFRGAEEEAGQYRNGRKIPLFSGS